MFLGFKITTEHRNATECIHIHAYLLTATNPVAFSFIQEYRLQGVVVGHHDATYKHIYGTYVQYEASPS